MMADNYLENHREEYENRKALWIAKKKHTSKIVKRNIQKPEDEAL